MNIDPYTGKTTATKGETRRFVEARILAEVVARQVQDQESDEARWWNALALLNRRASELIGEKFLDKKGYLRETAAEARVSASVPE